MMPGEAALTRMPLAAYSMASDFGGRGEAAFGQ